MSDYEDMKGHAVRARAAALQDAAEKIKNAINNGSEINAYGCLLIIENMIKN